LTVLGLYKVNTVRQNRPLLTLALSGHPECHLRRRKPARRMFHVGEGYCVVLVLMMKELSCGK